MASSVATVPETIFKSLPARPPTPPRESNYARDVATGSVPLARSAPFDHRLSLQTPPNASCASSADTGTESNKGSSRTGKKVEWSAYTQYKEPAEFIDSSKPSRLLSPSVPPSTSSKSIKGILKPSSSSSPLINSLDGGINGNAAQVNIIDMLDSTIKQLAGSDRDSRLDAYLMLARALKTSNNLPDRVALQGKMSLFMQFIQRDITSKNQNSAPDTSLINHALSLLATFLHFPAIASTLTLDFGVFIIDHAIRLFEDASQKKDVIRHLMQVVACQNFPPKIMTADRVGRLVAAVRKIDNHLTGKSIIMSRIHVYKRLVKQARTHMVMHSDWLQDLFTDMLSTIKEIRSQAIIFGNEAGFSLRTERALMRKAAEILQATSEGEIYITFYISRLHEMLRDKQLSYTVPQIWSVVNLFLKCPLEKWQYYGPWLTLAQSAFNTAGYLTKQEANYAWSRYIYLSLTDAKVSPKGLGTLCQPISSQLRRKSSPKQFDEAMKLRRSVISCICNLYYYTFVPGNDKYSTDTVWDVTVSPIMSLLISLDNKSDIPGDSAMQASHLLVGLLDIATPRVWRQDRIMDLPPVKTEELPSIDSKWVRRNSEKVFQIVGAILEKKSLDMANKESLTYRLWTVLVSSIALASAKDIMVSEDTVKFIGCTFSLIAKVWSAGAPGGDESATAKFFASIINLLAVVVQELGVLPFMEKKLSMTPDGFEPISTPSRRNELPDQTQGVARIPALHLFHILISLPRGVQDNDAFRAFFFSVFEPFFKDRPRKARLELTRELLHQIPRKTATPFAPWLLVAENIDLLLEGSVGTHASSPSSSEQPLGPTYREVVSLLDRGLMSHPNLPLRPWVTLFNRVCEDVKSQTGDGGVALVVVEPLAKSIVEGILNNTSALEPPKLAMTVRASFAIFYAAHLPRDAHAVEAARRRLWGTGSTTAKGNIADPFHHLYRLGNDGLKFLYSALSEPMLADEVATALRAVGEFLQRHSAPQGLKLLNKLQDGICTWILDEKSNLMQNDAQAHRKVVDMLWDQVCAIIVRNGNLSKAQFDRTEIFFKTALKSQHSHIIKKAAEVWNTLVKDEELVECSESLKSAMSSLRLKADFMLPGSGVSGFGAQSGHGGEDTSFAALSSVSSRQNTPRKPDSMVSSAASTPRQRATSGKRAMESIAAAIKTRRSKRAATPKRLRHEDSQVQFAPIATSSPVVEESQHLTERQKEVRERQRSENNLYQEVEVQNTDAHGSGDEMKTLTAKTRSATKQNGTPQREGQYSKHVRSTPTPRRGQVLQMDDANDPPSSPPLPLPNPLLAELESRSRDDISMENWEFSSPPGTPSADGVDEAEAGQAEAGQPQTNMSTEIQQPAADVLKQSQGCANTDENDSVKMIRSSALCAEDEAREDVNSASEPSQRPLTRLQKRKSREPVLSSAHTRAYADVETVESGNDSSVVAMQPALADAENVAVENTGRSKKHKSPRRRRSLRGKSTVTNTPAETVLEIIIPSSLAQVEPDSPSSPILMSTPTDSLNTDESEKSDMKRKRSRSRLSSAESPPKKRRSLRSRVEVKKEMQGDKAEAVLSQCEESSQSLPELQEPEAEMNTAREVRRSGRRRSSPSAEASPLKRRTRSQSRAKCIPSSTAEQYSKDCGDTDEEIMSQLVTETAAASNSQQQEEDVDMMIAATKPTATKATEATSEASVKEGDGTSVMDTLRKGLDQMRCARLSREDVYKMEGMLLDMKREMYKAEFRGRKEK